MKSAKEKYEAELFATWLDSIVGQRGYYAKLLRYSCIGHGRKLPIQIATALQREGLKRGVPDYLLVFDTQHFGKKVVFVELKRTKGGKRSAEQEEWASVLSGMISCAHHFAAGFAEAQEIVDHYLTGLWS